MASEWFYKLNGVKHGPVSSLEIRKLARGGTISPNDLLWKQGMKTWLPAGKSASLFPPKQETNDEPLASYTPGSSSGKLSPPAEDETVPAGLSVNDFTSGGYDASGVKLLDSLRIWGTEWTQAFRNLKLQHKVAVLVGGLAVIVGLNYLRGNRGGASPANTPGGASYIDNAKGTVLMETIARVREDMAVSEVRRLLGEPVRILTLDDKTRCWTYVVKIPAIDEYDYAEYQKWGVYFDRPETRVKYKTQLRR